MMEFGGWTDAAVISFVSLAIVITVWIAGRENKQY
jgi:hypothetical protein